MAELPHRRRREFHGGDVAHRFKLEHLSGKILKGTTSIRFQRRRRKPAFRDRIPMGACMFKHPVVRAQRRMTAFNHSLRPQSMGK